jgi:hypothetical protein
MANKNIQSALLETRSFPPPPAFAARARIKPADLETCASARATTTSDSGRISHPRSSPGTRPSP